jgi:thioesterase domain-containing protein
VRPHGPYLLGGFSGGGITAYEIARQLTEAGEEVAMLALLDTPLPVRPGLSRKDKALIKWQLLREQGPGYLTTWASNRLKWELGRLRKRFEDAPEPLADTQFHDAAIEAAFLEAVRAYRLAPWDGPVTLFRPPLDKRFAVSGGNFVSDAREYVWHDNQWTPFVPKLEVIEVPGDHDSMVLEPNVRVLAARLKTCLEAAERAAAASPPALAAE